MADEIKVPYTEEYDVTLDQFVREAREESEQAFGRGDMTPNEETAVAFLTAMQQQVGPRTLEDAGRLLAALAAPEVAEAFDALVQAGA